MVWVDAAVRTSLRVATVSKGVAVLPGVAAPRGDGERLGAAGLTEVMAALGE